MEITFDINSFNGRAKSLTNVLYYLTGANCFTPSHSEDIEAIACRTPSDALRYCRHVVGKLGVSHKTESVFLKNPQLGVRYLRYIGRDHFVESKTHTRFWKKIMKKPELALAYATSFNKRFTEQEEEVFVKNMRCMREYSQSVIKGPFTEKVHQMIILRSFDSSMSEWEKRYLKDYVSFAQKHGVETPLPRNV